MKSLEQLHQDYVTAIRTAGFEPDYEDKKAIFARLWLANPNRLPWAMLHTYALDNNSILDTISYSLTTRDTSINNILGSLAMSETAFTRKFGHDTKLEIDRMIEYTISQPFVFNNNETKNQQDMDKDEKTMEIKIDIPEGYEIDEEKSTFGCIRLKKKETILPATWEEFCATHMVSTNEAYVGPGIFIAQEHPRYLETDRNLLPSKDLAEAMLALCQLIQLRDCYNQGWTPSWNGDEPAYVLYYFSDEIEADMNHRPRRTLAFKTPELRDRFLENFRDLIEVAKPLL